MAAPHLTLVTKETVDPTSLDPRPIVKEIERVRVWLEDTYETCRRTFGRRVTVESALLDFGNIQPTETRHISDRVAGKIAMYTQLVNALADAALALDAGHANLEALTAWIATIPTDSIEDVEAAA